LISRFEKNDSFLGRFVLNYVPIFDENAILDSDIVGRDLVHPSVTGRYQDRPDALTGPFVANADRGVSRI
jgi:hypothetical protein